MSDTIQVQGIAYYPCVKSVNKKSGKYSVDLVVDDKTSKQLVVLGLVPAQDKKGVDKAYEEHSGKVFKFHREPISSKGNNVGPPGVVDSQGNNVDCLVGNGSKVNVAFFVAKYLYEGEPGCFGYLNGIQVLDLVPYEFEGSSFDAIEGGYVADQQVDPVDQVEEEAQNGDAF